MQFQLGIGSLSERRYAAAVEPLRRAEELTYLHDVAFRLRLYSLCMSGQTAQAQRLAQESLAQFLGQQGLTAAAVEKTALPPYWLWMKKTFGIDPLAAAAHSPKTGRLTSRPSY
jgi:hypothetical protein